MEWEIRLTKLIKTLVVPPQIQLFFSKFNSVEEQIHVFSEVLSQDRDFTAQFVSKVKRLSRREAADKLPLENAIQLYGFSQVRNEFAAYLLFRQVKNTFPNRDPTSKEFKMKLEDLIKCAIQTENLAGGQGTKNSEVAFLVGYMWDQLIFYIQSDPELKASVTPAIEPIFKFSVKSFETLMRLAKKLPNFEMANEIVAAAFLQDLGRLIFHTINPGYVTFDQTIKSTQISRYLTTLLEIENFGFSHAFLSSTWCYLWKDLHGLGKVMLHHHDPFSLEKATRGEKELVRALFLVDHLVDPKVGQIERVLRKEQTEFPLDMATIKDLIK